MRFVRTLTLLVIAAMPCLAVADNLPVASTGVTLDNLQYPYNFPWRVSGAFLSVDEILQAVNPSLCGCILTDLSDLVTTPDPSWGAQPTYNPTPGAANWINGDDSFSYCGPPPPSGGPASCNPGFYYYVPVFDLSGFLYKSLDITGRFAADNAVWLYAFTGTGQYGYQVIASAPYGPPYSYNYWTSFDLKGIEAQDFFFIVQNGNGPIDPSTLSFPSDADTPTGLIVDITSATGSPVPEPGSFALFGTGLLLLFGLTKRRLLQP